MNFFGFGPVADQKAVSDPDNGVLSALDSGDDICLEKAS